VAPCDLVISPLSGLDTRTIFDVAEAANVPGFESERERWVTGYVSQRTDATERRRRSSEMGLN